MKRTSLFAGLFTVIAAAALLLVACGDDDSPAGTGGSTEGSLAFPGDGEEGFDADDSAVSTRPGSVSGEAAPSLGAPSDGVGGALAQTSGDLLGRTIIRNGSVALVVDSVADSFERVNGVAVAHGGFVADSSFYVEENGVYPAEDGATDDASRSFQGARLTIRVPAEEFDAVIRELRGLAVQVTSISTSSQDVTEEYTDLESQLRSLRAVETRYLQLLDDAVNVEEILLVQDRLAQTVAQIEMVQGRINLLDSLSDLATLSVELRTPAAPAVVDGGEGPLDAAGGAWDASLAVLAGIATVALVAIVFSWWLVPVLVLAAVAVRLSTGSWLPRGPQRPAPSAPAE
jgi:hypothetical protein